MREIVLDTETTGLEPAAGHRVVEIGCVELVNHVPTGGTWQTYLNPERDMPTAAFEIHGLTTEFLAAQPRFAEIADKFLEFVGDDKLVIHNAGFDLAFINAELGRIGSPEIPPARAVDTLGLARRKYPGAPASLDALCRRFDIDTSSRARHGALLDARLLAQVYLELVGGRQPGLGLATAAADPSTAGDQGTVARPPRPHAPTRDEAVAHAAFVDSLTDPIWRQ
ncbi:MAG: DNA polymerase III subunit epsilon [Proteobacteria bacterium]|nr:DNA polymerase III subunit epsilon [Pseudomonadota bacterium]